MSGAVSKTDVQFPEKMHFLFTPKRYKVLYGGRGGAKSWAIARALLILGMRRSLRVLCARETQKSIEDSVHRLLSDQIEAMGLGGFYTIEKQAIFGPNGTRFRFEGIRHNVGKIKSFEGIDVCWVEEAEAVSEASWRALTPTIRKPGSEIWVSFNPGLKSDPTYQRFVVDPPENCISVKVSWRDNPWFPEVLRKEMEEMRAKDFDAYLNIWEGNPKVNLEGAVYAKELREAREEGRISEVSYDPLVPVDTFWDLGWLDKTAVWFGQYVAQEYRIIHYIQGSQRDISSYLRECDNTRYTFGTFWLPHDAVAKSLGTGRSIEEIVRATGRVVRIVPRLAISDGINAARTIFPNCWFDEKNCAEGLEVLSSYQYDRVGKPIHNEASHGADGFRYLAVALSKPRERLSTGNRIAAKARKFIDGGTLGWMR